MSYLRTSDSDLYSVILLPAGDIEVKPDSKGKSVQPVNHAPRVTSLEEDILCRADVQPGRVTVVACEV